VDWLLYSAIRKEALLTSQIEGTQATLTDLFDEEAGLKVSNTDDVEEVTNYLRAFRWVRGSCATRRACRSAFACCARPTVYCSTGCAVPASSPGELRRSQNWIGGTRPGNAAFVPPPAAAGGNLLTDLERFIHASMPTCRRWSGSP
jgi:Fic family protein